MVAMVVSWLAGALARAPSFVNQIKAERKALCFCSMRSESPKSGWISLLVMSSVEWLLALSYYRLLLRNKKAKTEFSIYSVTHSLDSRFALVETIKTTETILPAGNEASFYHSITRQNL